MAAEGDPALDAAETLLLIPDLVHYWLCGASTSEFTNATTTQCFDPHTGGWATDLLERLDVPTRLLPEVVQPGTTARSAEPRGRGRDEASRRRGRRGGDARHRLGGRRRAVPATRLGLHQRGHVVARRSRGRGAGDHRRGVRGESHQRGRRRRHVPPPSQRHRALAHPRVPPRVGAGGQGRTRSTSSSRWRRTRRRCSRSSIRTTPPSPSPATCRRGCGVLRAHRTAGAGRARRGRALHPREPRAEARADDRRARVRHRGVAARDPRRRRRRAQRAALPLDGRCGRAPGPRRAGGGNAAREPARAGDGARRDLVARRGARGRQRLGRADRLRAAGAPGGRRRGSASPRPSPCRRSRFGT